MNELVAGFKQAGLETHEREDSSGRLQTLGVVLDCEKLITVASPGRLWKVRCMIDLVLGWSKCSGRVMETLVGHLTFVGLLRRPVLSIMYSVYRFIDASYDKPQMIWESVKEELSAFRDLLPFLRCDW